MSEEKIKESLDAVTPSVDAKERMYRNILKKAQAQAEPSPVPTAQKMKTAKFMRYALPVAACICLLVIGATRFLPDNRPMQPDNFVEGGNPFVEVENADAFGALAIKLDAPVGAREVSYAIIDGEIAEIQFELDGKHFLARASAQEGDFSGLIGEELSLETVDAKNNAVLIEVETNVATHYKIVWTNGKIRYCLFGTDGASPEQVQAAYDALKK